MFEPNIFTLKDKKEVTFSHKNPLAITIVLSNHNVHRVLMNYGSTINILSKDVMKAKGIPIKGALDFFITISTHPKCHTLQKKKIVIKMNLTTNIMLGKHLLHDINIIISMKYLAMIKI